MEPNLDLMIENLNSTGTDDRKNGINNFLEAIKNYYRIELNETNSNAFNNLFSNPLKTKELFTTIGRLLRDPDWKIRKDTFEILISIITKEFLKDSLDYHLGNIMKYWICCLSDSITTVRKIATQCLHEYLKKSIDFQRSLNQFIEHGLNETWDYKQLQNINQALQLILTQNFSNQNFLDLLIALLNQLNFQSETVAQIEPVVIGVIKSLKKLIGDDRFYQYVSNLPKEIARIYNQYSNSLESQSSTPSPWRNGTETAAKFGKKFRSLSMQSIDGILNFGFIPQSIFDDLKMERKLESIELINTLFVTNFSRDSSKILPHLERLLEFVEQLLISINNYLVFITALKLLINIVDMVPSDCLRGHLELLLRLLRAALCGSGSGDTLVLQHAMALATVLFAKCEPFRIVERLCEPQFIADLKQPLIRQLVIDVITSALLRLPSYLFDLDFLCSRIATRLLDRKHKVKQAALECISVIGYNYGNGKLSTLLKIVEQATKSDTSSNALESVRVRLSKHQLPRIDDHGIVVYVTDNDKVSSQRQASINDIDNSSSDNSPISSANQLEKRRPSAGKVRRGAKFPWDQNDGNINSHRTTPFTKPTGFVSQNQVFPYDISNPHSQCSPVVSTKDLVNEGVFVRKFTDLSLNNNSESEKISNKSQQNIGRSNSTENQPSVSGHTSGYSSGSNTFRHVYENSPKTSKEILTATNSANVTPRNATSTSRFEDSNTEPSPIPTKPALGRSAGSRRKDQDTPSQNSNIVNAGTHERTSNEQFHDEENQNEPLNTQLLEGVRNSASKKKVLKLFNSTNLPSGMSYGPDQELSKTCTPNFQSNNGKAQSDNTIPQKLNDTANIPNSHKGPTFKSNPQYSALIVGKGVIGPSNESNDVPSLRKKQPIKGMLETSNPAVTQRTVVNSSQNEPKKIVRSDFQTSHGTSGHSDSVSNTKTSTLTASSIQTMPDFKNGIVGIGLGDKLNKEEDSDEEPHRGIMSNTLRESLSLKRQKAENELHSSKSEPHIIPTIPASYSAPGSGSHQVSHRKPPVGGFYYNSNLPSSAGNEREITNGYEPVPPSRKPLRPAMGNSTPKKIKPVSQMMPNPQANSTTESMAINPAPLNNPDKSLIECLNLIKNEDWENKISALITIQSLVQFHSDFLINRSADIHAICIVLCEECKNLRSQVAKYAIQTVSQLFIHLRKHMEPMLENIVSNLLLKAGEGTKSFLKQDVEAALVAMIENVSPNRAFLALLQNGAEHKNTAIRRVTACNVMLLCEKLGNAKTVMCFKEMPDKILPSIVKFAADGSQDTRYYGKKILLELSKHPDFEKLCNKHIMEKDLRAFKDTLDQIKMKGVGDPPQTSHSAGIQRSGSLSRGGSAGNLVALGSKSSSLSRGSSRSMCRLPGSELTDDDKDWLAQTCSQLTSSDFRDRQLGLESLLMKAENNGLNMPQKSILKLLKDFIPRLNDNNTKVSTIALDICQKIVPLICSIFPTEIFSEFINTIALNFASKSPELRNAASNLMDVCFTNLEHSLLIQPCIEAINKANPRTKPQLIENMNKLLLEIDTTKSPTFNRSAGMIIRHIIPEIGLLLEKNKPLPSQLRDPVHRLVLLSHQIVGNDMIDSVTQRGDHNLKQAINEILNTKNLNITQ